MPTAANEAIPEVLDPQEKLLIDRVIITHRNRPGALLEILEAVQSASPNKFLSMTSLRYIADEADVPSARIYSAATFYAPFNLDPQGDNVICVCRGTACRNRGSPTGKGSLNNKKSEPASAVQRSNLAKSVRVISKSRNAGQNTQ